jgi:predicted dehydrogenase
MGKGWIENARSVPVVELVGLVDLNRASAEASAAKFGLPPSIVFNSLAEAIYAADPDAVFDVTVPTSHEAVVIEALGAGKHVLGEKPMSESLDSGRRMVAAAAAADRTYAVTQNYRYQPQIRGLKSFLDSQSIGPVQECHADFFIGAHFGGFRDQMAYPLILDMSIHCFDAARFLTGADPVSVYCHSFNPARSWYAGDASAVVIFEMTNGIVFSYRGSWCSEGQTSSWNSNWRLLGSRGSVAWDGENTFTAKAMRPDAPKAFVLETTDLPVPVDPMSITGHAAVMNEFATAIFERRKPETDCQDNIKSLAMVLSAVESAMTGRKVPVQW